MHITAYRFPKSNRSRISTRSLRGKREWSLNISQAHSCYRINDIRHIVLDNRHASFFRTSMPDVSYHEAVSFFSSLERAPLYPTLLEAVFNALYVKNMLTMRRRPRRGITFESINARFFFLTARSLDEISRCINETRVNTVTFLSRHRRSSQAVLATDLKTSVLKQNRCPSMLKRYQYLISAHYSHAYLSE